MWNKQINPFFPLQAARQMALVAYGVLLFVVVATTGRAKPLEPEADDIKIEMRMPEVQPTKVSMVSIFIISIGECVAHFEFCLFISM